MKSVVGSYKKVSMIFISASSFCRSKPSVISHVLRKGPKRQGSEFGHSVVREDSSLVTIVAVCPESIDHIMRKPEWDDFRFLKCQPLYHQIR